jgi:hypothetical protein
MCAWCACSPLGSASSVLKVSRAICLAEPVPLTPVVPAPSCGAPTCPPVLTPPPAPAPAAPPGTIISHNVPPYGRAGLYKQLAAVKDLVAEYREGGPEAGEALKGPIIEALNLAGLQQDCPYTENEGEGCTAGGLPACLHCSLLGWPG